MKRWLLLWLSVWAPLLFAADEGLEAGMVNPGHVQKPAWFKESFLELREDLAEAEQAGKGVLLYFYQDGCPYCERLINVNFSQPQISAKTRSKFDLIAINMWGDREVTDLKGKRMSEKQFALGMKVQFTPTLLFLDGKGNVVLRINGYYPPHKFSAALDYASGDAQAGESFAAYLARLNPTPVSGTLHSEVGFMQPPYQLAIKGAKKPLLVLFEQKECPGCDEMHGEAFQRPEIRALLNRFDVALVDIWSEEMLQTNTGEQLTAKEWARRMNIQYTPSLVFFNTMGKEVFRTEAYLRPFHLQAALDYVSSGAYREQKEFQRFVQSRAEALREGGSEVELWK